MVTVIEIHTYYFHTFYCISNLWIRLVHELWFTKYVWRVVKLTLERIARGNWPRNRDLEYCQCEFAEGAKSLNKTQQRILESLSVGNRLNIRVISIVKSGFRS